MALHQENTLRAAAITIIYKAIMLRLILFPTTIITPKVTASLQIRLLLL